MGRIDNPEREGKGKEGVKHERAKEGVVGDIDHVYLILAYYPSDVLIRKNERVNLNPILIISRS